MNFSLVLLLVTVLAAASARPSDFDLDVEHQWEMFKVCEIVVRSFKEILDKEC